ncbi:MAG TPA: hypothetical protein VKT73_10740 [Xanthobacteraceae bacterium]|nr:hypothetical protein [Xanthobacteraceae bacterium]
MARQDEESLRNRKREGLREARLQAHYAVQWLGRFGGAFVSPEPDYSHTSMDWHDSLPGLATKALKDGTRLGLRISDLLFVFLGKDGAPIKSSSYPLDGRTDKDVRQWLGKELGARGMDAATLDKIAPYEIPAHAIAKGAAYDVRKAGGSLGELEGWFAAAHSALEKIRRQMSKRSLSASPVRGWPHHFDIATLISLDAGGGEHGRSVNAGLSPGDEYYNEPYYYVSPYPHPAPATLPSLSGIGHWHTKDFTAAIATMFEIADGKNKNIEAAADDFLQEAVDKSIKILG